MAQPHFNWSVPPELRIWRKHSEENGNEKVLMEAFGPDKHIDVMSAALQDNTLTFNGLEIPLPLNMDIVKWATETKRILQTAKLPEGVKFYNLFGTSIDTPFHAWFQLSPSVWWLFPFPLVPSRYFWLPLDPLILWICRNYSLETYRFLNILKDVFLCLHSV
jgi:hypothetical protein